MALLGEAHITNFMDWSLMLAALLAWNCMLVSLQVLGHAPLAPLVTSLVGAFPAGPVAIQSIL